MTSNRRSSRVRGATSALAGFLILVLSKPSPALARPHQPEPQVETTPTEPRPRNQLPVPSSTPGNLSQPDMSPPPLTPKQQRDILKSNYEKMKEQADELADLAKSLRDDLNKSNQNILSLQVVDKADKIEKLAKKIRDSAKGH